MNKNVLYGVFCSFALVCFSALSMDVAPESDPIPAATSDETRNNDVDMVMLQSVDPDLAQMYEGMLCQEFDVTSAQEYQAIWERARVDVADTANLTSHLLRANDFLRETMVQDVRALLEDLHDCRTLDFYEEVSKRLVDLTDINSFIEEWDIIMGDMREAIAAGEKDGCVEEDAYSELGSDYSLGILDKCADIEEAILLSKISRRCKKGGLPMSERKLGRIISSLKPTSRRHK